MGADRCFLLAPLFLEVSMIEKEELKTLEKLSKLSFTEKEEEQLQRELESILLFADQIKDVKQKTMLSSENSCDLREDEVVSSFSKDDLLHNAPTKEQGFFKLPRRGKP